MRALLVSVIVLVASCGSDDEPGSGTAAVGVCGGDQTPVIAPGCEGPPVTHCADSTTDPVVTTWCDCEGRVVSSSSNLPPTGARYHHEGPCRPRVAIRVQELPEREGEEAPRMALWLVTGPNETSLGELLGCSHAEPSAPDLLRVRCWWAGAGDEVSVRREGNELVVMKRHVEEEGPDQPPTEVTRVTIPSGAEPRFDTEVAAD